MSLQIRKACHQFFEAPLDKDLGLLITEDDLDTEVVAGRGMRDVYQHDLTMQVEEAPATPPQRSNKNNHKRKGSTFQNQRVQVEAI